MILVYGTRAEDQTGPSKHLQITPADWLIFQSHEDCLGYVVLLWTDRLASLDHGPNTGGQAAIQEEEKEKLDSQSASLF